MTNNITELLDGAVGWALGWAVELPVLSALCFLSLLPTTVTTVLALFRRVLQAALYLPLPAQVLDSHLPFRISLKPR